MLLCDGTEAIPKQVGVSSVTPVEAQRIAAIEALERLREPPVGRLQDEVVVVLHQAVAETAQLVASDHSAQALEEVHTV